MEANIEPVGAQAERTRDALVFLGSLQRMLAGIRGTLVAHDASSAGARSMVRDVLCRLDVLEGEVDDEVSRIASGAWAGAHGTLQSEELLALTARMFEELVSVSTELRDIKVSRAVERVHGESMAADALSSLGDDLDATLARLQEAHQHLADQRGELAELSAQRQSAIQSLRDLRRGMARNEAVFGSPSEQLSRAKLQLRAMRELSSSVPFQIGYLLTSTLRSPHRVVATARRVSGLAREVLARWRASRAGVERERRDAVGVALPEQWVSPFADMEARLRNVREVRDGGTAPRQGTAVAALQRPDSIREARVAVIADEFTLAELQGATTTCAIGLRTWRKQLDEFRPQLLIVESAWAGNGGQWRGHVESAGAELRELLAYCRAQGVATIFWNKEDPVHFEHFLPAASLFDHVATTDLDRMPEYFSRLGHERVSLMPFATNPAARSPVQTGERLDACSFAGSFYARYQARNEAFSTICRFIADRIPLRIYDRNHGTSDPELRFPPEFQRHVAGKLPASDLDVAYKGYRYAITVNSTPDSQTMVARRVFDLLASGTHVVSNYSRALKLLFGDLLISTDDPAKLAEEWERLRGDESRAEVLRLVALRKVLREHTVAHRLSGLFEDVYGGAFPVREPHVVVVALVASEAEHASVIASFRRQRHARKTLKLVFAPEFAGGHANLAPDVEVHSWQQARAESIHGLGRDVYVAGMSPRDYYGPDYLSDMALATAFAPSGALGKAAFHEMRNGTVMPLYSPRLRYSNVDSLALRRAMVPAGDVQCDTLAGFAELIESGSHESPSTSLDGFSYCEAGAASDAGPVDASIEVDQGLPYAEVAGAARRLRAAAVERAGRSFGRSTLQDLFPAAQHAHRKVTVRHPGDLSVAIDSTLESDQWAYVYATANHQAHECAPSGVFRFLLSAKGRLSGRVVVIFYDRDNNQVGSEQLPLNTTHSVRVPKRCISLRLALRIVGSGHMVLGSLDISSTEHREGKGAILTRESRLLVAKGYPSQSRLYHYSFIHRRVLAYRENGLRHDVFRWNGGGAGYDEFQGVDIISGGAAELSSVLSQAWFESIDVHPLYPEMWDVLQHQLPRTRINVWVHGAEVQPWYRRSVSYPPGLARERAARATSIRLRMWRSMFALRHPNLHFVFVSEYLARIAMADIGVELEPWQYSVIHNFIDGSVFAHSPKDPDQRRKILSIRPYSSPLYANDLAVEAVLALSRQPFFDDLQFLFVGDGRLFEETLAPLREFANVEIRQGFLTQQEIADLHKEYGIFLVPSRMDTQGVSRDEAMSSGLVPATNRVAAIPEFVDGECAILADPEDSRMLAEGIARLYADPDLFASMSRRAAERVAMQSGAAATIAREIELIRGGPGERRATVATERKRYRHRVALYGDLNLNITDGSAIWAASLAQVLAGMPDTEVVLFLKAPVTALHIIAPLLELENLQLVEPGLEPGNALDPAGALASIRERDEQRRFDAIVLRGFQLCSQAVEEASLVDRLWVYITDLPSGDAPDAVREQLARIMERARFVLCQTPGMERHLVASHPELAGRTAILPPMIPAPDASRSRPLDAPARLVYAGKFAPMWGIREMLDVFRRLRAERPELELHVFGDKIHNVAGDPDFRKEILDRLQRTDGLVWHKQVTRDELVSRLPDFDIGWAWRHAALEDDTHELSTKVLEYAACRLPMVVYPNQVNRELLGEDYPLFARDAGEAHAAIARLLDDEGLRTRLRERLVGVAGRYTFDSVRGPLFQLLQSAKGEG